MPKRKQKKKQKQKTKKIFEFFKEHKCLNCSKMIPTPMLLCSSQCRKEYNPEKTLAKFLDKMKFTKKAKEVMLLWYQEGKLPHLENYFNLKKRYASQERWI